MEIRYAAQVLSGLCGGLCAQAFAAYGMSFLFVRSGGDYLLLFALGSCALVLALVVDLVVGAIGGRS
jgi:hypothetical protein